MQVTMTYDEVRAAQNRLEFLQRENERLEQELTIARVGPPEGEVARLTRGFRIARYILGVAFQHVPGKLWDYEQLLEFTDIFDTLPDHTVDDVSICITWRELIADAKRGLGIPMPTPAPLAPFVSKDGSAIAIDGVQLEDILDGSKTV